jgi:hypothetical protein
MIFILGFCILLSVFYRGYQKSRPAQQLFKEFILVVARDGYSNNLVSVMPTNSSQDTAYR